MRKLDKRVKWVFISGLIVFLLIPPGIILGLFFSHKPRLEDDSLINAITIRNISPTPNSDIKLYSYITESNISEYFHYQFNFTFDIEIGIEPIFTDPDRGWTFIQTDLNLMIKVNLRLEFYIITIILNSTDLQIDESQQKYSRELNMTQRLDNIEIILSISQSTDGEEGAHHTLGGSIPLFTKDKPIMVENISSFSGIIRIYVNDNNYTLQYSILSHNFLQYELNSSITDTEIQYMHIRIRTVDIFDDSLSDVIYLPCAPGDSPGIYSDSSSISLKQDFIQIRFIFEICQGMLGPFVEYKILPLSEILEQEIADDIERRNSLRRSLSTYFGIVTAGITLVLGCMASSRRKELNTYRYWY